MKKERTPREQPADKKLITVRPVIKNDADWITRMITQWWGSTAIVTRGYLINATKLPGFLAMREKSRVGLVTYAITGPECEIVTLNSLRCGQGVGTRLLDKVKQVAHSFQCTRLVVITTNDNMHALRFYQKKGFSLVTVHRNALDRSRRLKKEIPLIGRDGVPLRDEIELEMLL